MFLENNFSDGFHENGMDIVLTWGYVLDRSVDVDKLKNAFESVIHHFPVLSARMDSSGKKLFLPTENVGYVLWSVVDHNRPMSEVFTPLPTVSDRIIVSSTDEEARMDFYFPQGTTRVSRKGAAGRDWPLIEICIQRFTDKSVIALAWNHMLTDAGGMAIIVSSWTKALRGEVLPEVAPYDDVFKDHFPSNPTAPIGSVVPTISRLVRYLFGSITDNIRYGSPKGRTIFIPNSLLNEWKENSGVSTNDLLTAWLFKAWASTINSKSLTISIEFLMDLRKHLPEIVPETYLRNASYACVSPHTLTCAEINEMSQLQLAQTIRSIIKHYTPEVILNDIAYGVKYSHHNLGMFPKGNTFVVCTSWSKFNLLEMDFGAKTESFEGIGRSDRKLANMGCIWLEHGGARIGLSLCKKKWNRGIWQELLTQDS